LDRDYVRGAIAHGQLDMRGVPVPLLEGLAGDGQVSDSDACGNTVAPWAIRSFEHRGFPGFKGQS
jgi:hypothetical protein